MSSELDYLIELKDYIENNSNLSIDIIKNKKNMIYIKYFRNFIKYIFIIIILILIYYLFGKNIFFLILFFVSLYILLYIYSFYSITKQTENINESLHMNFETGDILQEKNSSNLERPFHSIILSYILNFNYFHNLIVIKFKDKHFALHCMLHNYIEPTYKLKIKNSYIEIVYLENYIDSNKKNFNINEYRLFRTENNIKIGDILKGLESLNVTNMIFTGLPFFPFNKDDIINRNQFNCCSFILKLLHNLNIIPLINYHNFTPNDYVLLPELSNNFYKEPVNIIYK